VRVLLRPGGACDRGGAGSGPTGNRAPSSRDAEGERREVLAARFVRRGERQQIGLGDVL